MRPGRPDDLAGVLALWQADVAADRRDCVPGENFLRRVLAGFDWEARSRVVHDGARGLQGAVLVTDRSTPEGSVARIDASVADSVELFGDLMRWGLGLSRAAGAVAAQAWTGPGRSASLDALGMRMVRPWWRMDRSLANPLPKPEPVTGYRVIEGSTVGTGTWSLVHNGSFADHWRFSPRSEDELIVGRPPNLSLLAVTADGRTPAALTLCQIETYTDDRRPQPVGVVSSVGTMPGHRRKGLARWLVAEALLRLHDCGAPHASLYVDGWNPTRAFDLYRELGFALAFEAHVWEASFS